jgi:hypothetical protein
MLTMTPTTITDTGKSHGMSALILAALPIPGGDIAPG